MRQTCVCLSWIGPWLSVNHTLLWCVLITASAGTFLLEHYDRFNMCSSAQRAHSEWLRSLEYLEVCVCVNSHDQRWAHPGSDPTLWRCTEFPPCWRGERERLASSFTERPVASPSAPLKRLHCSRQSEARKWAEELWGSPVGQRLGWWALGRCLKPHGGEAARHRASLCDQQPTAGASPQLNSAVWKGPLHHIQNTPSGGGSTESTVRGHTFFHIWCRLLRKGSWF